MFEEIKVRKITKQELTNNYQFLTDVGTGTYGYVSSFIMSFELLNFTLI